MPGIERVPWHPSIDPAAWEDAKTNPRVLVIDGPNVTITVRDGHLSVTSGPAKHQATVRIPRIPRELDRIIILACHGLVTIEAQRWLHDCGIPFAHLDRDGQILSLSGPKSLNARLIRAQSYAPLTATGLEIARYLLATKLEGQACLLETRLAKPAQAEFIRTRIARINQADNIPLAMTFEGLAAERYWKAWEGIPVPFGSADAARVPVHWRKFTDRFSQAGDKPRNKNATDPVNAMLNYLYAIAATECLHVCHALSLSPVLGIIHADKSERDSFVLDLLETVRPTADRIILDMLLSGERIDRLLFTELRDGIVWLNPPLSHRLAAYSTEIGEAVSPFAYQVGHMLAQNAAGIVTIPRPKTRIAKQTSYRGYPAARLRPGVQANDLVTDELWREVCPLIPAHARYGQPWVNSDRDMLAVFLARYMLKCPWRQCLAISASPVHKSTAANRWKSWYDAGVWARIWDIAQKYDHWNLLKQDF